MKITEIISENIVANEALPTLGSAIKGAAKMLAPSEKTLAKRAAQNAEKADVQVAKNVLAREWEVFKERMMPWMNGALWGGILVTPAWDYYKATNAAEKKLKAGIYTQENYNYVRQMEASKLVTTLTVGISGKAALSVFRGLITITRSIPIVGKILSPVLSFLQGLDTTTQAAFVAFLNTETGRRWLAILASFAIFEGTPYEISMPNIAGNLGTWLLDTAQNAIGNKAEPTPSKAAPTTTQSTGQSATPTTPTEPSAQEFKPSTTRDFYTGKIR